MDYKKSNLTFEEFANIAVEALIQIKEASVANHILLRRLLVESGMDPGDVKDLANGVLDSVHSYTEADLAGRYGFEIGGLAERLREDLGKIGGGEDDDETE